MRYVVGIVVLVLGFVLIAAGAPASAASKGESKTFDITTLAGKVASIQATDGFYLRVSPFLEQEADAADAAPAPGTSTTITPTFILSSPLDGNSVAAPAVTVNQDTLGAPQNEPAIAVDPNNADRIVVGSNDYIPRTWTCTIDGTPCSALGDAYSGTYYSNDGGATWCCVATDPSHLGTLIPGVERLTGGIYDAGGDPSLAFDSQGHVFFAGLGFDRTAAPNTVAVNKGTFDSEGALTWGPPTFINPTKSPSTLNDKEWIGADTHAGSPFQDRVYVSWTRFIFNPHNGRYVQSPIAFVFSSDGGATFSDPQLIVSNVLYDQGSRVVVGPDGTVYVFWEGSTRFASFNSIWMVSSSDGGVSWSKPVAVAPAVDIIPPFNTVFRVNSFPAADIAPDGTLYVAWSSEVNNDATTYGADPVCAYFISGVSSVYNNCHSSAVWSKSTDGGATWSSPVPIRSTRLRRGRSDDGRDEHRDDPSHQLAVRLWRRVHRGLHEPGGWFRQCLPCGLDGHEQQAVGRLVVRVRVRVRDGHPPTGYRDRVGRLLGRPSPGERASRQKECGVSANLCELRRHRDVRLQEAGYRAPFLGRGRGVLELPGLCSGDFRGDVQVDRLHGPARVRLVEVQGRLRVDPFRVVPELLELARQGHRKAARVRGGDELLGIRPRSVAKPRCEAVRNALEGAAQSRYRALPVFQASIPLRARLAVHRITGGSEVERER